MDNFDPKQASTVAKIKKLIPILLSFEFIRFAVTGTLGVITDETIFIIMKYVTNAQPDSFMLFILPVFGYAAAVIQNYLINHYWSFRPKTAGRHASFKSFLNFLVISLISLVPRQIVYWLMPHIFTNGTMAPTIANLFGIMAGMITNYIGCKFIVFRFKDEEPKKIEAKEEK
ncbi:GtrA family protein [bacterium]|nr:GtrA family protein [bacterium]